MSLELETLGTQTVYPLEDGSFRFEAGPKGTRSVSNLREIVWEGDRINARSKWANGCYVSNAGVTEVEVRAMFETEDRAMIFMRYLARVDLEKAMRGPGEIASLLAGQFETADPSYAWLNLTQLVGSGRFDLSVPTMTYSVYALRPVEP